MRGAVAGAPAETANEAYILEIMTNGVKIIAPSSRGENWAQVTLEQLVKFSDAKVPCCRITDWPKFRWRGFMLDSGRNFLEGKHVKALVEAMQRSKMNLFHWHLTEYYGWRLESKIYPELQRDSTFYRRDIGKYYTQEEFREIVEYADARGITVMPEFDVPGHAFAFRRAFGFKTMRDVGVREKLCELVDELCSLVPAEKMPFLHLGSDEARNPEEKVPPGWMEPLVDRVHAAGRTVVGWTPGELKGLTDKGSTIGMRWGDPKAKEDVDRIPCFDAYGMYLDTLDPFELLGVATYRRICPWDDALGLRYGAITCAWHDDYAGGGIRTIENQCVIPALVLFGDSFWCGREDRPTGESGRILPRAGSPRLKAAQDLERRVIAQRDKVWADFPYPFQFVGQTQMRWRVLDGGGNVVAKDVAQGTVFFWQAASQGVEGVEPAADGKNLLTNKTGVAVAETWIRS
ncbi:MAG TPA: family 20 glycosylhydrolase, partial [Opitutales bacterium]|nr:family 20 glycosylhydrolase [Opitutales bacterium]